MKIIVVGQAASPAALFRVVIQRCKKQMARLIDPYRPEHHYMRGPGPKWRERHGLSERPL